MLLQIRSDLQSKTQRALLEGTLSAVAARNESMPSTSYVGLRDVCEKLQGVFLSAEESGEGHSPLLIRWNPYFVSLFLPSPLVTLPSPFVSLSPLAVSLAAIFFVSPLPFSLASAFFVSPLALSLASTFLSSPLPLASAFFSSAAAFFSSPIFSAATAAEARNIEAINTLRRRFIKSSLWIVRFWLGMNRWLYRPPLRHDASFVPDAFRRVLCSFNSSSAWSIYELLDFSNDF